MVAPAMSNVLIFGATSRVAHEVARIYAGRGHRLALAGRDPHKLAAVVADLGEAVIDSASFDACDHAASERYIADAWTRCGGFDVTLIAHGWLGDQRRAESDGTHARAILEVNLASVVTQLVALQPRYAARGRGSIAVCSSVAAQRGRPRNFTYGAAKAGLDTYLEGLRSVLWPHVTVTTLHLGPVDSPMTADHDKNFSFSTATATAAGIVAAIDRKRSRAFVPGWWRAVMFVVRNLPEWAFQRLRFLSAR